MSAIGGSGDVPDAELVRIHVAIFSHEGTMYGLVYGNLDREPQEVVAGFELVE